MCLSKSYDSKEFEVVFPLDKHRKRVIIYAIIQSLLMMIGLLIIVLPPIANAMKNVPINYSNFIVGAVIICTFGCIPKPIFWHIDMIGDVYLVFNESKFKIYLMEGKFFNCRWRRQEIGHYSLFRGIAWNIKKHEILFLCKGIESLAAPSGESINKEVLEKISMWWFANKCEEFGQKVYFGATVIPFKDGLQDEQGLKIEIDFDYYKKYSGDEETGDDKHLMEHEPESFERERGEGYLVDGDEMVAVNIVSAKEDFV